MSEYMEHANQANCQLQENLRNEFQVQLVNLGSHYATVRELEITNAFFVTLIKELGYQEAVRIMDEVERTRTTY